MAAPDWRTAGLTLVRTPAHPPGASPTTRSSYITGEVIAVTGGEFFG